MYRISRFSFFFVLSCLILLGNGCREIVTEEVVIDPSCDKDIEGYWVNKSDINSVEEIVEVRTPSEDEIELLIPIEEFGFYRDLFPLSVPILKDSDQPLSYLSGMINSPSVFPGLFRMTVKFTSCNETMMLFVESSYDDGDSWDFDRGSYVFQR